MAAYGYCPVCGAEGQTRERRPNGDDTCVNGHKYPSSAALKDAPEQPFAPPTIFGRIAAGLYEAIDIVSQPKHGALAICVASHQVAESLASLIGASKGQDDQGIRVIPFGASAFVPSPGASLPFRGLVVVSPHPFTTAITPAAFEEWLLRAVLPHMAPNAPRIDL